VSIQQLQDKIAGIENSRALDRTTAIEDQLRTTAERLQALERMGAQVSGLAAENTRLRQELRGLEGSVAKPSNPQSDDAIAPLPPIKP
jgi:replicative DNA helicase